MESDLEVSVGAQAPAERWRSTAAGGVSFDDRRRTAARIFTGALTFNAALTVFWLAVLVTGRHPRFFTAYAFEWTGLLRIFTGVLFFYVVWGFIWWGVKNALLKFVCGFSKEERRQAFSSRMDVPFDVAAFVARHSERRIRIVDMIGRRGRFLMLAMAGFYYLYLRVAADPNATFATGFLQDNLFDAVVTSWIFLAFFYGNGVLAAAFYGPQSRVMDGVLARANCLLITTLWTAFKFVLVPIGAQLATVFSPAQFPAVFGLIWGSYIAADGLSEVGGSLFGRQKLRVWGIGDVNRKSIEGTLCGFLGSLALCLWIVHMRALGPAWMGLAVVISLSNTFVELYAPRGTDDLFMATGNALICWAFGVWIL